MKRRFFLDCEFLESGPLDEPIHLLSIGLVCEDGRELYLVNKDCPIEKANPWVQQNVLPHIDMAAGVPRDSIRSLVLEFVGKDAKPEFWSCWGSYDWVCLAGLMGRMADLPKDWPKFIMDLKQWAVQLGNPKLPSRPNKAAAHNALNDARWHKALWMHLDGVAKKRKCGSGHAKS